MPYLDLLVKDGWVIMGDNHVDNLPLPMEMADWCGLCDELVFYNLVSTDDDFKAWEKLEAEMVATQTNEAIGWTTIQHFESRHPDLLTLIRLGYEGLQ